MYHLIVFVVILILIWSYIQLFPTRRLWNEGNKLPGPKPLPIFGNSLLFLRSISYLQTISELWKVYGPVFRLWFGKDLFLILTDPSDVEFFLTSQKYLDKSDSYRLLDPWLGNKGLITSDAGVWRTHRKLLTPSFHFKILESSIDMVKRNALFLCDQLEKKVNKEEFDVLQFTEKCSLDIISETAMGINLETQKSNNTVYLDCLKQLQNSTVTRFFSPWLTPELPFKISSTGRKYYKSLCIAKDVVAKVIEDRRKLLENAATSNEDNDNTGKKRLKPFLDFMLLESDFTDEEIENEVQTFLFAGHDTTTITISFCLYSLSKHPDVQKKILEELKDMMDGKIELTYHDYLNMKYLDNVIKETLRMFSTVPIISRKIPEDILLPSGYTLPANSLANICIYCMHNDENLFPNPDHFLPERFEEAAGRQPFAFVPFSAGPRNCIGQKFAMLEMKVIVTEILQKYQILPSEKVQHLILETGIVLRSLNKIPIRLAYRDRNTNNF